MVLFNVLKPAFVLSLLVQLRRFDVERLPLTNRA
jgi:hypothetical protein